MDPLRGYYLWNIGCQMNRADASRIAEALERRGYMATRNPKEADLLILNTCVVRQSAEDKVVGRLNSLKPLAKGSCGPSGSAGPSASFDADGRALIVMGCFVGDQEALRKEYPFVDAFLPPSDIEGLLEFVDARDREDATDAPSREPLSPVQVTELVPISYGCDHRCTYCIVTLRRGAQQSRPISEIVADVEALVDRGAREITLLGQNVDAYGTDLPGHPDLADALRAIHDIHDLWRIRFLTSHPKDMTQEIIDTVAALPKVCESWELPVQSGDDEILRRMGRGYTVTHFRDLVRQIRAVTPDSAINTDIIVGFPGESVAQFEATLGLVQQMRFDVVHVAAYSPRPGTPAARWADDVDPEEKERRRALVEEVQTEIASEINAELFGQKLEILIDGRQRGRWRGRTRTNKLVFVSSPEDWLGRMARVQITWTGPWSMRGKVLDRNRDR